MVKDGTINMCLVLFLGLCFSIASGGFASDLQRKDVHSFLSGKRFARSAEWSSTSSEFAPESESDSESDEELDAFQEDFQRSRISRNAPPVRRILKKQMKNNLRRNDQRTDASCGTETGGTNGNNEQPPPWSLDTGVVPDSLQGGGSNDGLEGISTTVKSSLPWSDIFNADPIQIDDNPSGGSDWSNTNNADGNENTPAPVDGGSDWSNTNNNDGNNEDGKSDWANTNNNNDGNGNAGDGSSDWANTDNGGSEQNGPSESSTDQPSTESNENGWGSSSATENQEEPDCTCMSIMACGGTFRSGDFGPDICADGEVCCPIERTELPEGATPSYPNPTPSCGVGRPNKSVKARVMTESTALFGELPWTAMLMTKQDDDEIMFCAGTIVDLQVVVTAAHCLEKFKNNPEAVIIRGGEWDVSTWGREPVPPQDRAIESITFHPSYRSGHPVYDLAIILLRDPFTFAENLNSICLPSDFDKVDETRCIASGWGKYPKDQQLEVMKKIVLPIVSRDQCQQALRTTRLGKYFRLHKSFICAGANGNDVCLGDGGGPLTCPMVNADGSDTMVLMGITSWGIDCGLPGIPGVFADIPSEQRWLLDTMALLLNKN